MELHPLMRSIMLSLGDIIVIVLLVYSVRRYIKYGRQLRRYEKKRERRVMLIEAINRRSEVEEGNEDTRLCEKR